MSPSSWSAFIFISLAATFSPGPGVLLAITSCITLGPRRTLYSSAGNALGIVIIAALSAAGVGALMQSSERMLVAVKLGGAAYLIYLGLRQWPRQSTAGPAAATVPAQHDGSRKGVFLRGMLVALSNPKALIFFGAIFPQFMSSGPVQPQRFIALTAIFLLCLMASHSFYILLASRAGIRTFGANAMRTFSRLCAVLFVGLGCALLVQASPG